MDNTTDNTIENTADNDKSLLIQLMTDSINNKHSTADVQMFADPQLAETYNSFFKKFITDNNANAMDLNNAMNLIGNVDNVMKMLETVGEQKIGVEKVNSSVGELVDTLDTNSRAIQQIDSFVETTVSNSQSSVKTISESMQFVDASFGKISEVNEQVSAIQGHIAKINEIVKTVKMIASQINILSINASIEAARAGQAGKGFAVVAEEVRRLSDITGKSAEGIDDKVELLQSYIRSIITTVERTTVDLNKSKQMVGGTVSEINNIFDSMKQTSQQMHEIFDANKRQNTIVGSFVEEVRRIADHANNLYTYCNGTGSDLYKISRAVDRVRGNIARKQADLTPQDWLKVFATDHIIFTWRMYNMVAGFEVLEISGVNNPKTCKLGLWYNGVTDNALLNNRNFADIEVYHRKLHDYAVECVNACNSDNHEKALRAFQDAMPVLHKLLDSLEEVGKTLR
jgi:methyl-accepting chemotaxis protein